MILSDFFINSVFDSVYSHRSRANWACSLLNFSLEILIAHAQWDASALSAHAQWGASALNASAIRLKNFQVWMKRSDPGFDSPPC